MGKISDFLTGTQTLEIVESPINGKITVVRNIAFGTYIQVNNLTQSGGIIKNIWDKTLRKVKSNKKQVTSCLVLGLGGGSVVGVVKKYWPEAKITAVDIDPIMVDLGKKYLGLGSVDITITDAYDFLNQNPKFQNYFDLVLVDLYVGDEYPKKFESENYIQLVSLSTLSSRPKGTVLASGGVAVFNRLYYGEKRSQAVKFGGKLEKYFKKVEFFYPEANLMLVCSN